MKAAADANFAFSLFHLFGSFLPCPRPRFWTVDISPFALIINPRINFLLNFILFASQFECSICICICKFCYLYFVVWQFECSTIDPPANSWPSTQLYRPNNPNTIFIFSNWYKMKVSYFHIFENLIFGYLPNSCFPIAHSHTKIWETRVFTLQLLERLFDQKF